MKKFLLSLLVCVFWLVSFWNCVSLNPTSIAVSPWQTSSVALWTCVRFTSNVNMNNVSYLNNSWEVISNPSSNNELFCFEDNGYIKSNSTLASMDFQLYNISSLYSWYILESAVDTNFCVQNDLCPVPDNFSQLFINDLEFQSHPIINVFIPDYITWDYTWSDSWFDLYVWSGYNVDYINSIIDINSYRPDSADFTNIFVSGLTLVFPYIIFCLFLVFMWKLIKRIFK